MEHIKLQRIIIDTELMVVISISVSQSASATSDTSGFNQLFDGPSRARLMVTLPIIFIYLSDVGCGLHQAPRRRGSCTHTFMLSSLAILSRFFSHLRRRRYLRHVICGGSLYKHSPERRRAKKKKQQQQQQQYSSSQSANYADDIYVYGLISCLLACLLAARAPQPNIRRLRSAGFIAPGKIIFTSWRRDRDRDCKTLIAKDFAPAAVE